MPRVVKKSLLPVMYRLICDCGGEMKSVGAGGDGYPSRNEHRCVKCNASEVVRNKLYPYMYWEEPDACAEEVPHAPGSRKEG